MIPGPACPYCGKARPRRRGIYSDTPCAECRKLSEESRVKLREKRKAAERVMAK